MAYTAPLIISHSDRIFQALFCRHTPLDSSFSLLLRSPDNHLPPQQGPKTASGLAAHVRSSEVRGRPASDTVAGGGCRQRPASSCSGPASYAESVMRSPRFPLEQGVPVRVRGEGVGEDLQCHVPVERGVTVLIG